LQNWRDGDLFSVAEKEASLTRLKSPGTVCLE